MDTTFAFLLLVRYLVTFISFSGLYFDSAEGQTNNDRPIATDSRSVLNVTEDKTNGKDTNVIEQGCNLRNRANVQC
ncbi:hypothetical protein T11_10365 [Trichinella zimbabwensis]|uniref:Secreted protein n=1 Tax=Trichinella zimbabwensis TaxID=268475 RepID=A0A0V1GRR3_9BILA|nr:hypothetical protein T11_10365 [Trichinella zimbabwensis]